MFHPKSLAGASPTEPICGFETGTKALPLRRTHQSLLAAETRDL